MCVSGVRARPSTGRCQCNPRASAAVGGYPDHEFVRVRGRFELSVFLVDMEIDKVVPVAASVKPKLGRGGQGEELAPTPFVAKRAAIEHL